MALTTDSWKVNADGDWGTASNWSAGLPNSNSAAVINTSAVHTITYSGADSFVIGSLTVGNDFFDMSGGSLTILTTASFADGFTQTGGTLTVGGAVTIHGTGTLTGGNAEGNTQFTIDGTVALANYTLGGAARLTNTKTTDLTGNITLGDNTGVNARIDNQQGATFNIAADLEVFQGAASASFVNAGTLEKSAGSNTTAIDVSLTDTGAIVVDSGTLEFRGPTDRFAHSISGAGVFALGGGSNSTIEAGTKITTGGLLITDPGTLAMLDGNLAYAHAFTLTNSATLDLAGVTLTLSGTDTFSFNARLDGTGSLVTQRGHSASINGFTLGGGVIWQNSGIAGEAGAFQIGDASFNAASLVNEKGGVYEFTNDAGIAVGAALNSSFINDAGATLEKIGGSGTSVVQVAVEDEGAIVVRSGTIEFTGFSNSLAGAISGRGQLGFGVGSQTTIGPGTRLTVAGLLITDGGTTVTLGEKLAYAGHFSLVNTASLDLNGVTLTLSGADTLGAGTIDGSGTLVTVHGATVGLNALTLASGAHWQNAGTVKALGTLVIGDAGFDTDTFLNEKGGTYDFVSDGGILIGAQFGSSFVNSAGAVVEKTNGTGDSVIETLFTNSGSVRVTTGEIEFTAAVGGAGSFIIGPKAQLRFDGAVAKGSSIDFASTTGGQLLLSDSRQFGAAIHGFGGRNTDSIFLGDINFNSGHFRLSYAGNATKGVLTVSDGTDTAHLTMFGHYRTADFHASADGAGTLIVDPPWHDTLLASAR